MFSMKKSAGLLAASLILLPMLAACGPEAASTPTPVAPTATSAPAVQPTDTTAPATSTTAPEETPTEEAVAVVPRGEADAAA